MRTLTCCLNVVLLVCGGLLLAGPAIAQSGAPDIGAPAAGGSSSGGGSFGEAFFAPLPPQGADLPIWIGATAEPALRRVGRIAQGYHSTSSGPEQMRERIPVIREAAEAVGRPMPTLSSRVRVAFDARTGRSPMLAGSAEEIASQVRGYRDVGVSDLALDFGETEPEAVAAAIERFDREVVAAL